MSVKYEDKDLINSVKLAAYEYAYKNLRSGPSVVHLSSLSELLKIFFPAAQIVIKYDVDSSCFGAGEKTIEKIHFFSFHLPWNQCPLPVGISYQLLKKL